MAQFSSIVHYASQTQGNAIFASLIRVEVVALLDVVMLAPLGEDASAS